MYRRVYNCCRANARINWGARRTPKKVVYPETAKEQGIEARVTVQFLVTKEGSVICSKVIRGIGKVFDIETIRVVSQAKFTPGLMRGEPVVVQYSLPIVFRLQS